ncbi:secretory phospholipase A2 receptor-like isoform X1 [Pungitius pungitius]|uniref:secretory phospholipase A2 receptor-like isoform X1 n=2 Tax=Pungitius pungitius TaxID=134920 RepID=UPI002E113679
MYLVCTFIEETMLRLVILLLASSCVTLCSLFSREYHLINEHKTWDGARAYCRQNHSDLATIGNRDDLDILRNMTNAIGWTKDTWIGLRMGTGFSWKWSVGEPENIAVYTNWAAAPGSGSCGSVAVGGKWLAASCGSTLGFICKEGKGLALLVVSTEVSWWEARQHCLQRGTDLAVVRNQAENQMLRSMFNESKAFWVGLFRDEWQWSDQSDSSFRSWEIAQPNSDGSCALLNMPNTWFDRACGNRYPFICHTEKEVRKQTIVKVEMKSNSDLNDPTVSEAILNQIQQKYGMVKLQWRIQPDGKIFHKKEKKEIKETCKNKVKSTL